MAKSPILRVNVDPGLINPWLINRVVSPCSGDSSLLEGTWVNISTLSGRFCEREALKTPLLVALCFVLFLAGGGGLGSPTKSTSKCSGLSFGRFLRVGLTLF